ncbi:MAG: DUF3575 domain-containing protein [Lutibacter sp.]|nr:DUF3575 domain-containing protein [Lutibacter sp.]MDT8417342.1 DUF3575 domain-containing protein [Lutibacter sp.]
MKKITLSALLFIVGISLFAQENETKQNELKINMSNLIGFKWFDVSYERLLNEEASIGVGTLFSLDKESEGLDEYRTFSITPYYRQFFSSKYAQGFFVEAFTMLHSAKQYTYNYIYADFPPYESYEYTREDKFTDFAVGISVGGKWVTKRGFVAEVYAGIGRDLLNQSDIEVVGRGGVSIGYRFQ